MDTVKDLLDKQVYGDTAACPNIKGLYDWSALHLAAAAGNRLMCEILYFHSDLQLNARTETGMTALHLSCMSGFHKVVAFLVKIKADMNVQDNLGNTCLHLSS